MAVRGVDALQSELHKAKTGLKNVDENIAKLTGRDPTEGRPGQRRVREDSRGSNRLFVTARRGLDDGPSPAKRRASGGPMGGGMGGGAFSRLGPRVIASRLAPRHGYESPDEEDAAYKPSLASSVVATPKETRSREEVAEEQNKDRGSRQRNRRMFGLLLGTLQRFKDDEKDKTDKEKRRQEIEKKLEEKAKAEQEDLKKERQNLFKERQRKQEKIRQLEHKMELVRIHEEWESQTKKLGNFVRTKAKPHIYFQPKSHNSGTLKRLDDTKKILQDIIRERKKQLEEEIDEITKRGEGHDTEASSHRRQLSQQMDDSEEEIENRDSPHKERQKDRSRRKEVNGRESSKQDDGPPDLEDEEGPELMDSQITRTFTVDIRETDEAGREEERDGEVKDEAEEEERKEKTKVKHHDQEPSTAAEDVTEPMSEAEAQDNQEEVPDQDQASPIQGRSQVETEVPTADLAQSVEKEDFIAPSEKAEEMPETPSKSSGRKRRWDMKATPEEPVVEPEHVREEQPEPAVEEGEVKMEDIPVDRARSSGKHRKRSHSAREESDGEDREHSSRRHERKKKKVPTATLR